VKKGTKKKIHNVSVILKERRVLLLNPGSKTTNHIQGGNEKTSGATTTLDYRDDPRKFTPSSDTGLNRPTGTQNWDRELELKTGKQGTNPVQQPLATPNEAGEKCAPSAGFRRPAPEALPPGMYHHRLGGRPSNKVSRDPGPALNNAPTKLLNCPRPANRHRVCPGDRLY